MKDRMSIVIVLSDRLTRRQLEVNTLQYLCKRAIKLLNVVYCLSLGLLMEINSKYQYRY